MQLDHVLGWMCGLKGLKVVHAETTDACLLGLQCAVQGTARQGHRSQVSMKGWKDQTRSTYCISIFMGLTARMSVCTKQRGRLQHVVYVRRQRLLQSV